VREQAAIISRDPRSKVSHTELFWLLAIVTVYSWPRRNPFQPEGEISRIDDYQLIDRYIYKL
jgi:hypothetical protein